MDRPWKLFRCPIDVRRRGRYDQQLISAYLVSSALDFAPSLAFRAVDENCFRSAMFTRARVSPCLWIISRVCRAKFRSSGSCNAVTSIGLGTTTMRCPLNPSCFSRHFIFRENQWPRLYFRKYIAIMLMGKWIRLNSEHPVSACTSSNEPYAPHVS